ncbi:MAG: hypothetical protein D6753_02785 [Planctomycetota bacterium]|nr:MAG: hypothetical protein D6753_02785 [Planctomycetota bacterium]
MDELMERNAEFDWAGRKRPDRRTTQAAVGVARRTFLLVASLWWAGAIGGVTAWGQSERRGLHFGSLGRTPQTIVYPGGMLVLQAQLANYNSTPETGMIVATVDGVQDQQSARRFTLAPRSTRQIPLYIQVPQSVAGKDRVEVHAVLYIEAGGREVIQDQQGEPAEQRLVLNVERLPSQAALIMDPEPPRQNPWLWPLAPPHWSYELVIGARVDAGASRLTASFDRGNYPLNRGDWAAIKLMVIAQPDCLDDAALVDALKSYVAEGGRLWVMLDHVPCERIRPLLGVGQAVEQVDEVELNTAVVTITGSYMQLAEEDRRIDSDQPLRLVRVVQQGGRVTHAIDGWPVAMWMPYGYGEILLTTLDAQAWIQPRQQTPSTDVTMEAAYTTQPWAHQVALNANADAGARPLEDEVEYPSQHIGNPVVPRGWVAATLSGFCLALVGLALWMWRVGDLSRLAWGAPIAAAAFSIGLLVTAGYVRRDVQEGVARLQTIQVAEDGSQAIVREQGAVYLASETDMALESKYDGQARASDEIATGIRRYEVLDFQRWRLTNANWPAGLWRYRSDFSLPYTDALADAHLTDEGLRIEVPASLPPLQDPVIAFAVGDPMLGQVADGGRVVLADGSLRAEGQRWVSGTLISAEQLRRVQVYQQFFAPVERGRVLRRVVHGWIPLPEAGPRWSRDLAQRGSGLVSVPIRLRRPPAGQPVYVPHGLVQLHAAATTSGQTSTFDDETGRWAAELTMEAHAALQFELPDEILPFEATALEMELDVRAPHRAVRLSCTLADGTEYELVTLDSPSIPWKKTITDPRVRQAVRDGTLQIRLDVSQRTDVEQPAQASNVVTWEVRHLLMSLRGAVARSHGLTPDA